MRLAATFFIWLLPTVLWGCAGDSSDTEAFTEPAPFPTGMRRLTDGQYRRAVFDLLGVTYEGALPVDYDLHGYTTVGATEVTIAPYDLALYEGAAWRIAEQSLPTVDVLSSIFHCPIEADPLALAAGEERWRTACVEPWVLGVLEEAWRRPILQWESEEALVLFTRVADEAGELLAAQSILTFALLSPDFLFQIETGEPDPYRPGQMRLTAHELAARLAFFVTGSAPDPNLRAAADDNSLLETSVLNGQARRLLLTERSDDALVDFFTQSLDLDRLEELEKSRKEFPLDSPQLREEMRVELEQLFLTHARGGDFREILTTDLAYVGPELASLYGLDGEGFPGWAVLPPEHNRGGLLGRAGFLALNATAVRSSPTHRGKFIRTRMLCQSVPAPPEGVIASLETLDETLSQREKLEQHMADPACSSCHELMDPLGFPLENFDALGQWRTFDGPHPIDATGVLDGKNVEGAAELGVALAEHQRFDHCMTTQLMRHGTGRKEGPGQSQWIGDLTHDYVQSGHSLRELVLAIVGSDGFRSLGGPLSHEPCTTRGEERPCESSCGEGVETCLDGVWQGCTGAPASAERCDGLDQDCNGEPDGLSQSCWDGEVTGVQFCDSGTWSECDVPPTPDVCDGFDNDGDGEIDEDQSIQLVEVSFAELQARHANCNPAGKPLSGACNAAVNRFCSDRGCGSRTGFGLLALDLETERASVACLPADRVQVQVTTFDEMAQHHERCTESYAVSPECNASINRYCALQDLSTGFGPLEHSNGKLQVACTPDAETKSVGYEDLGVFDAQCVWPGNNHSRACHTAIHFWCESQGYQTGFGPLENWDNQAIVACLGREP